MPLPRNLCAFAVVATLSGCGGAAPQASSPQEVTVKIAAPAAAPAPVAGGAKPDGKPEEFPAERKIKFSGTLEIVVKDFDAAKAEVTKVVTAAKGYFAKTDASQGAGKKRTGTFTLKVPAEKFAATVEAFAALGIPVRNTTDSEDMTEEFVDVQARVKNLKAYEDKLNALLAGPNVRWEESQSLRKEINTVRGDIERAEGRLKVLTALTSLSTITLTLREEADYVPPSAEPPATFGDRLSRTFDGSVELLRKLGEAVAIGLVAVGVWLPVVVPVLIGGWWANRRWRSA